MNDDEKKARIEELTKKIAWANALGVRAEVCSDAAQKAEAKRIYAEAKSQLYELDAPPGESVADVADLLAREIVGAAPPPPVDRTKTTLTDGSPVTPDHRELRPDGQQKAYVVLSAEERVKGFVRPVRRSYTHEKCGTVTTMGVALAETYARDPSFYGATFCAYCSKHFPVGAAGEFFWAGSDEKVGT